MTILTLESINKLHELIDKIEQNRNKYSTLKAIYIFGPMGAGKSTYIQSNFIKHDMVYVSIDDYFNDLHKFDVTIEDTYLQCREIGRIFTDWLLDNKISFLTEGTGSNSDIFDFFIRLKNVGYSITSHFLSTPLETCLLRVENRNKFIDRKVSSDKVVYAYKQLWENNQIIISKLSDHSFIH